MSESRVKDTTATINRSLAQSLGRLREGERVVDHRSRESIVRLETSTYGAEPGYEHFGGKHRKNEAICIQRGEERIRRNGRLRLTFDREPNSVCRYHPRNRKI